MVMIKKLVFLIVPALLMVAGCYRNEPVDYKMRIEVYSADSVRASNVFVEVGADIPNSQAQFSGLTDEDGVVRFTYNAEAVLQIRATRGNPISFIGCGFIRLKANEEVVFRVYLQPYDPVIGGC
jgi:hypothetical protein